MSSPKQIGKYEIRGELGRGGMGVVWRAHDPVLDRDVAIKQIGERGSASRIAFTRFLQEARALARIGTPHVVSVYECVPDADPPYLVMELVEGRSLHRVLRDEGGLPIPRLTDCAAQVLLGLDAAHRAGIFHRDIKPSNLLVAGQGLIKIADFGLAAAAADLISEERLTNDNEVVGTVRYLAPEVARGGDHSVASDLYALGITLIELAVGQNPYASMKGLALVQHIAHVPLRPVRELIPGISSALATWLDRLLAFEPRARFSSCAEALRALDAQRVAGDVTDATLPITHAGEAPRVGAFPGTGSAAIPGPSGLRPSGSASYGFGSGTAVTGTVRPQYVTDEPTAGTKIAARRLRLPFAVKLTAALWLVSSLAAAASGIFIARHAIGVQLGKWREEMAAAAAAAALMVSGSDQLAAQQGDVAAQARVYEDLRNFLTTRPRVRYIYTMAKTSEGGLSFVCDASDEIDLDSNGIIDSSEKRAASGDAYDAARAPRMLEGFTQPSADDEPTADQWGMTLSGYAPIKHGDDVVGIVGLDIAESHLTALSRGVWIHVGILEIGILLGFLAAAWLIAQRFDRPIRLLLGGLRAAARGDRAHRVEIASSDEFGEVAIAFNRLQDKLRENEMLRQSLERLVTRGISGGSESGRAALLACDLVRSSDPRVDIPRLLDAVRPFGGSPEGVAGHSVLIAFAAFSELDQPSERAVRAALAIVAVIGSRPIGISLREGSDGQQAEARARELAERAAAANIDIIADAACNAAVLRHFYADRMTLGALGEAYAIKGAVGAG